MASRFEDPRRLGVRAGRTGDSFIELRATLARDANRPFAVAAESAAYLLGLASRRPDPDREVIGAPASVRTPKALRDLRVVHWTPRTEFVVKCIFHAISDTHSTACRTAFHAISDTDTHDAGHRSS